MTTRPILTLSTWATGTYGAGPPWGGTAQSQAPGFTFFTPGTLFDAEHGNYLFQTAFVQTQNVLNWSGSMAALNFAPAVASYTTNLTNAQYQAFGLGNWWAVGNATNDLIAFSGDLGVTWTTVSVGGAALTLHPGDIAASPAGHVLVVLKRSSGTKYYYSASSFPASFTSLSGSGASDISAQVSWDNTNQVFVSVHSGSSGPTITHVDSGIGSTMTATATSATSWASTGTDVAQLCVSPSSWLIVHGNGTGFFAAKSTDLGATWAEVTITSTITSAHPARPFWDDQNQVFVQAIYNGTNTELWTSPATGSTWTKIFTSAGSIWTSGAALGSLWTFVDQSGVLWATTDKATTWAKVAQGQSSSTTVASGGGQFLLVDSGFAMASQRQGFGLAGVP